MNYELFKTFSKIGAFTFGGGYAMIPMIEAEVVDKHHWISKEEFLDLIAVAQSCPGVFAINISTFIGFKLRRYTGAVVAAAGAALPSFLIILLIASGMTFLADFFASPAVRGAFRAVTAAIAAMVAVTAMKMRKKTVTGPEGLAIALVCFFAITVIRLSPPYMIAFAVVFGIVFETCRRAKRIGEEKP